MEGRVTWFPLGRFYWLERQREKTSTGKKDKSPLFFNLIYYWLSSKNCYSLNEIITLVLPFPLSRADVWGCGASSLRKCIILLLSPGRFVRRKMKTKNTDDLPSWNSLKENEQISRNRRVGSQRKEKIEITDRNGDAQRNNFLIRGQQMCPWAPACWSLSKRSGAKLWRRLA